MAGQRLGDRPWSNDIGQTYVVRTVDVFSHSS
jgi:hypothetical protein